MLDCDWSISQIAYCEPTLTAKAARSGRPNVNKWQVTADRWFWRLLVAAIVVRASAACHIVRDFRGERRGETKRRSSRVRFVTRWRSESRTRRIVRRRCSTVRGVFTVHSPRTCIRVFQPLREQKTAATKKKEKNKEAERSPNTRNTAWVEKEKRDRPPPAPIVDIWRRVIRQSPIAKNERRLPDDEGLLPSSLPPALPPSIPRSRSVDCENFAN